MKSTLLQQPVITEKSLRHAGKNIYTFLVDRRARKSQIKTAVETTFNVKVVKVTTSLRKSSSKRTGRRRLPQASASPQKIARVWLKPGETIDLFEFQEN